MKYLISIFVFLFACVIFIEVKNVYAAVDPIAYWKFDDGSGTTPIDSSGNGINGTFLTPNPVWSTDVPSGITFDDPYSLDFTGSGDGVSIAWPAERDFADTDPRSFSFWYKPTANGEGGGTMARIISWSNDRFEIAGTDGSSSTHRIAFYDGNWHSTDINLTLGTWYFVIFTYNGTTAKFYIGDELQDEHALAGRALSGTMMIGNRVQNPNEGINGFIDDVRIYDVALDEGQVANLAAGSDDPDTDPNAPTPTPTPAPSSSTSNGGGSSTSQANPQSCTSEMPQGVPDLFQIETAKNSATLYFAPVNNASNYAVSYGMNDSIQQYGTQVNMGNSTGVLSFTINDLNPNTQYSFAISAQNGCAIGSTSNTMKVQTGVSKKYYKNFATQIINTVFSPKASSLGAATEKFPTQTKVQNVLQKPVVQTSSKPVNSTPKPAASSKTCFLFICW